MAEGAPSVAQEQAFDENHEQGLPESKLGTKEHWDEVYAREVKNFTEIGDEGEIWFGEDAVDRMVTYLSHYIEDTVPSEAPPDLSILDLGTGNGHLLFSLLEAEIEPPLEASRMKGVDYSAASVDLAWAIAATRDDERCKDLAFEVADLLDPSQVEKLRQGAPSCASGGAGDGEGRAGWSIVCDKGTLDAIALSSQPVKGKLPIDLYTQAVKELTRPGGLFLITSCNFTQDELIARFSGTQDAAFTVEKVVPTTTFSFGGQKGSTTTTISFKRTQ